jgi:hypothetical protein
MDQDSIIKRLKEPFTCKEIEWKIQTTTQDKARGMAVAYIDSRAIQKRLDEVVGTFNWQNAYAPWQDKAQICGLSIHNAERGEWVTKFDGAENTDYEPIKGGLSDAFKRAAILWGIGRYLYELDGVWVEIEQRGKSYIIKENQFTKLDAAYNSAVAKIFGTSVSGKAVKAPVAAPPAEEPKTPEQTLAENEFKILTVKPSGKSSHLLELMDHNGEVISAYVKSGDAAIKTGACLRMVELVRKESTHGPYNLISAYKTAA